MINTGRCEQTRNLPANTRWMKWMTKELNGCKIWLII